MKTKMMRIKYLKKTEREPGGLAHKAFRKLRRQGIKCLRPACAT